MMFKRVITQKGFWKSVFVLGLVYALVLFILKWAFTAFSEVIFQLPLKQYFTFIVCGLIAGLFSAYGKYWAKLKQDQHRK